MFENKNQCIHEIIGVLDIIEYKTDIHFLYHVLEVVLNKVPSNDLEQFDRHLHHLENENFLNISIFEKDFTTTIMYRLKNLIFHTHLEIDSLLDILEFYLSYISIHELILLLNECYIHVNYYNISLSPI